MEKEELMKYMLHDIRRISDAMFFIDGLATENKRVPHLLKDVKDLINNYIYYSGRMYEVTPIERKIVQIFAEKISCRKLKKEARKERRIKMVNLTELLKEFIRELKHIDSALDFIVTAARNSPEIPNLLDDMEIAITNNLFDYVYDNPPIIVMEIMQAIAEHLQYYFH